MRFSATAVLEGCWNTTVPLAPILNEAQFSVVLLLVWFTVKFDPLATALAVPEVTKLELLQAPGWQGMGNCVGGGGAGGAA